MQTEQCPQPLAADLEAEAAARLRLQADDAARYRYILDCEASSARQYIPDLDVEQHHARRRASVDKQRLSPEGQAISAGLLKPRVQGTVRSTPSEPERERP